MSPVPGNVTQLLKKYCDGDKSSLDELLPLVYQELRRIAGAYLKNERGYQTLQPTALVHEAYLRLVSQRSVNWQNRAQFYGLAAQMMRRILVNHAVAKKSAKRGGGGEHVSLDDVTLFFEEQSLDVLALDEALNQLAEFDREKSRLVELKFFGGLTTEEIAEAMGKPVRSVEREWFFARAWLFKTLTNS